MASSPVRHLLFVSLLILAAAVPQLQAQPAPEPGPRIEVHSILGTPPAIDGKVSSGEWPWDPQIAIDSSYRADQWPSILPNAPAFAIFATTETDLYILVDIPGDLTDTADHKDECLFWFEPPGGPTSDRTAPVALGTDGYVMAVIYGSTDGIDTDSLGGARAIGFGASPRSATPHRIFEFRIPMSAIGATPGGSIPFCSPFIKYGSGATEVARSMGYDGSTGHDNVWPPGLDTFAYDTWAAAVFPAGDIPATDRNGLAAIAILLALLGALVIRRI